MNSESHQPLTGIKIVDFSSLIPGPLATLILQEAGAEVIRITRPDGDPMAKLPPYVDGVNAEHIVLSAGKKGFATDLKNPAHIEELKSLIETADILVEGFRPGVMDRLGLGYADLHPLFPSLIYCSITGYGQNGPNRSRAGHDLNYQAESGLLALSPGTIDTPSVPPALVADIAGGSLSAVVNILLAVLQREKTGKGAHLDIAMSDGTAMLLLQAQARRQATNSDPSPRGEMLTGGCPRYDLYPTSDGRFLAVGAIEEKFWVAFCETAGVQLDATQQEIRSVVQAQSSEYWSEKFANIDACVSVVCTLSEAVDSEQAKTRGLYARQVQGPDGSRLDAVAVPISETFRRSPTLTPMYQCPSATDNMQ